MGLQKLMAKNGSQELLRYTPNEFKLRCIQPQLGGTEETYVLNACSVPSVLACFLIPSKLKG